MWCQLFKNLYLVKPTIWSTHFLYMGDLIYLEEHGDNVARFQTLQQVIDFIERVKKGKRRTI